MAYPFTDTPKIGVDLNNIIKLEQRPSSSHRLGSRVWASDGLTYVYAQAASPIEPSTESVAVDPITHMATGTGGEYKSPSVAMEVGDQGWFVAGVDSTTAAPSAP